MSQRPHSSTDFRRCQYNYRRGMLFPHSRNSAFAETCRGEKRRKVEWDIFSCHEGLVVPWCVKQGLPVVAPIEHVKRGALPDNIVFLAASNGPSRPQAWAVPGNIHKNPVPPPRTLSLQRESLNAPPIPPSPGIICSPRLPRQKPPKMMAGKN